MDEYADAARSARAWAEERSSRSIPTGPGSRGGRWHDRAYRAGYMRAWRAAHPEYRERERLRMARVRQGADVVDPPAFPRPLPLAATACACDCGCRTEVVMVCGFCRDELHGGDL